ncbi:hypothetical protein G6011_07871 [Alternaria panax]|uniref:C2H2-type domain-containing protein n=1 Tax=Alternaria panax TaxID=48097 RepID=A0AAD4F8X2_9PLEO|nr:hypothetical protein G6011_07871 [Alternaria panax]
MRRGGAKPTYHCAICEQSFTSKAALQHHTANHSDISSKQLVCAVCGWCFDDSHALELHQIQSSHGNSQSAPFNPPNESLKAPAETFDMAVTCDRCDKTFKTQKRFSNHRSDMASNCADWRYTASNHFVASLAVPQGYVDLDKPKDEVPSNPSYKDFSASSSSSETGTVDSENGVKCRACRRVFHSRGQYNNHMLGCTPILSSKKNREVLQATGPGSSTSLVANHIRVGAQQRHTPAAAPAPHASPFAFTSSAPTNDLATFFCNANGCSMSFRSEAGLRQHKNDAHGVGSQALNPNGRAVRERMRQEGLLLPPPPASPRGRGGQRSRPVPRASPSASRMVPSALPAPPAPRMAPPHRTTQQVPPQPPPFTRPMPTQHHIPPPQTVQPPASISISGVAELDQAKHIQAKILRLLIQSDIFIQHYGSMNVCGIDWTRIGVAKQNEVIAMFNTMCHLPKILQGEYVPAPKAFKDDYNAEYPHSDFEPSPTRNPSNPALGAVAISCSKVVLKGGLQEIVKIAAVDLVTCRILMNHLVCTDGHAEVSDWRSAITGLFSWKDMEAARKSGYKVFKGWAAARAALHKFVDKKTIVVGHNLRSDLDSLRMIHGRAVDIAKVVEKAAQGPLSKAQLGLDSLCRDYPDIRLSSDPDYGRDSLMNAFAIREFGLWSLKNNEEFVRKAKQKSRDYQIIMPKAAVVVA